MLGAGFALVVSTVLAAPGACPDFGETIREVETRVRALDQAETATATARGPLEASSSLDGLLSAPVAAGFWQGEYPLRGRRMEGLADLRAFLDEAGPVPPARGASGRRGRVVETVVAAYDAAPGRALAAANAFVLLDTVYNAQLYASRDELPRLLEARRLFSELGLMLRASVTPLAPARSLDRAPDSGRGPPTRPAIALVPGELGAALLETERLLQPSEMTEAIFLPYVLDRLRDPELRREIGELHTALNRTRRDLLVAGSPRQALPDLWTLALRAGGSADRALELLGVFTSQHQLLPRTILTPGLQPGQAASVKPLIQSASNFFLIQEIVELQAGAGAGRRFPFPPGVECRSPRFYHFWSAAFLAAHLAARGYAPETIRLVAAGLGRGYKLYTLGYNQRYARVLRAPRDSGLPECLLDVEAHDQGCAFGLATARSR